MCTVLRPVHTHEHDGCPLAPWHLRSVCKLVVGETALEGPAASARAAASQPLEPSSSSRSPEGTPFPDVANGAGTHSLLCLAVCLQNAMPVPNSLASPRPQSNRTHPVTSPHLPSLPHANAKAYMSPGGMAARGARCALWWWNERELHRALAVFFFCADLYVSCHPPPHSYPLPPSRPPLYLSLLLFLVPCPVLDPTMPGSMRLCACICAWLHVHV